MTQKYLDFDLQIQKSETGYTAQVLNSPAGPATSDFELPFSELEIENFILRVGRTRRGVRRIDSPEMEAAKLFGGRLFEAVFHGAVRDSFRSSLDEAQRQQAGLRIRLRLTEISELVDLPWEYLYNPDRNRFFSLSTETPIVHYPAIPVRIQPLRIQPPLRVLVMIASPQDYPSLDVEEEWTRLKSAVSDLEQRGLIALERLERATLAALQRCLRRGIYHVFHFVGHGTFDERTEDGILLLENEQGRGRPVSGQYIGTLLHDERTLRLAVLNACEGARTSRADPFAGTAQSLVQQGVPAVIAMQFEITDQAAITLAHEFYAALADGYPVDAALAEARKAIYAQQNDVEWGTPVLYMRSPDGVLFELDKIEHDKQPTQDRYELPAQPSIDAKEQAQQLEKLYSTGLEALRVGEWEEACRSFQAIANEDPEYRDASARLQEAKHKKEQETEKQKRETKLNELYHNAVQALDSGQWLKAQGLLNEVQKLELGYRETGQLLVRARTGIEQERRGQIEQQRQEQVSRLYEEAIGLAIDGQWERTLAKMNEIHSLDPQFADPQGIVARAQAAIDRKKAAVRQENELAALYAESVRLLQTGKYRAALEKWAEVQQRAPRYPDRNKVEATAKRKLAASAKLAPSEGTLHRPTTPSARPRRAPLPVWFWPAAGVAAVLLLVLVGLVMVALDNPHEVPVRPSATLTVVAQATSVRTPTEPILSTPGIVATSTMAPTEIPTPLATQIPTEPPDDASEKESYQITVKTSQVFLAGTDANVYLTLFGESGVSTEEKKLDNPGVNEFEIGSVDTFVVKARNVGEIDRIRIRHDNSGFAPGWHLESIHVASETQGKSWSFVVNEWLATDEPPYKTDRTFSSQP